MFSIVKETLVCGEMNKVIGDFPKAQDVPAQVPGPLWKGRQVR